MYFVTAASVVYTVVATAQGAGDHKTALAVSSVMVCYAAHVLLRRVMRLPHCETHGGTIEHRVGRDEKRKAAVSIIDGQGR
jgi:hypothetical protein